MPMIGAPALRVEDERFLRGEGRYIGDIQLPFMAEAHVVRSTHARARIAAINVQAATAAHGVLAICTAADLAELPRIPCRIPAHGDVLPFLQPVLAAETVRYVGEPVAIVVATSRALAEDAAELVEIDWEPLPQIASSDEALAAEAGWVHTAGNVATEWQANIGDVDAAVKSAAVRVTHRFTTQRQTGMPLETRGLLAHYDRSRRTLEVHGTTKIPHTNRRMLAAMLPMSEGDIRFIEPDVGGSFGVRGEFYPEDFLIPWLALRLRRPVRWIEDRFEHFAAINHSRQAEFEATASADADGILTAFDLRLVSDMGAYMRTHGDIVPSYIAAGFPGPYRVRNYRAHARAVMTNKSPTGTIRSPGTFESNFVRERLVDMVAQRLGLDRAEIRRRNLIRPEEMPWSVGTKGGGHPTIYDSGDFPAVFARALAEFGWDRAADPGEGHRKRGRGMAVSVEPSALGIFETARVEIDVTGHVRVVSGCTSQGQGQETILAQIAAEVFDLPLDRISVIHGDTGQIQFGGGTNASRAAVMAGNAVYSAALGVKEKALHAAARKFECAESDLEIKDGCISVAGVPGLSLPLGEIARLVAPGDQRLLPSPKDMIAHDHDGLTATHMLRGVPSGTSVFAVHLAEVAVDPDSGQVEVERLLVACDIGRAINPMIVEGQLVGGAAQGVGCALLEEIAYDGQGQLLTATLSDYLVPTAHDVPPIKAIVIENSRSPSNTLGVKGVGEVGPTGVGATIGNAIADALSLLQGINALPITPSHVLDDIASGNAPS